MTCRFAGRGSNLETLSDDVRDLWGHQGGFKPCVTIEWCMMLYVLLDQFKEINPAYLILFRPFWRGIPNN